MEAYQLRENAIPAAVRKNLPPLPPVWDTSRLTHRSYGRAGDEEPLPQTWEAVRERLAREIEQGIAFRWQDYLQAEAALSEASKAFGIDVTHPRCASFSPT